MGELCSPSRCCQNQRPLLAPTRPMLTAAGPPRLRRTSAELGVMTTTWGGSAVEVKGITIGFGAMADLSAGQGVGERASSGLFHNWRYVLATTNPPPGRLDPISK